MTTDEKKEFARLNAGRRVQVAQGRFIGREGNIVGYEETGMTRFGEPGGDKGASSFHGGAMFQPVKSFAVWYDEPENLVAVDNGGPLKFPDPHTKQTPHGAAVTPTGPPYIAAWKAGGCAWCGKPDKGAKKYIHYDCMSAAVKFPGGLDALYDVCDAADRQPAPASKPSIHGAVPVPVADLHAAATAALVWLCEEVPLPGCSKERERRLLEVTRNLKAALRGGR